MGFGATRISHASGAQTSGMHHRRRNGRKVKFEDVAKLAGLFLIADAFVAIAIYASLGAGVVRTWMLVLGVVEALGLVVYFGSAIWDSLPKSVQKSLE